MSRTSEAIDHRRKTGGHEGPTQMKSTFQVRLGTLLLVVAGAGSVLGLLGVFVRDQAILHHRDSRKDGMRFVVMALANYCDAYKRLPPAIVVDIDSVPLASWRLATLTMAEQWGRENPIHDLDFTMHWDNPINKPVTGETLSCYCFERNAWGGSRDTNVFAVIGVGTAFERPPNHLDRLPKNAVVLIEVSKSGIPWPAPGDLDVARLEDLRTLQGNKQDFHVAFADGSVWCLRTDVPLEVLRKFLVVATAGEFDRDQELGPYRVS